MSSPPRKKARANLLTDLPEALLRRTLSFVPTQGRRSLRATAGPVRAAVAAAAADRTADVFDRALPPGMPADPVLARLPRRAKDALMDTNPATRATVHRAVPSVFGPLHEHPRVVSGIVDRLGRADKGRLLLANTTTLHTVRRANPLAGDERRLALVAQHLADAAIAVRGAQPAPTDVSIDIGFVIQGESRFRVQIQLLKLRAITSIEIGFRESVSVHDHDDVGSLTAKIHQTLQSIYSAKRIDMTQCDMRPWFDMKWDRNRKSVVTWGDGIFQMTDRSHPPMLRTTYESTSEVRQAISERAEGAPRRELLAAFDAWQRLRAALATVPTSRAWPRATRAQSAGARR